MGLLAQSVTFNKYATNPQGFVETINMNPTRYPPASNVQTTLFLIHPSQAFGFAIGEVLISKDIELDHVVQVLL